MKYIATFYSHFGAIRFKREAPTGVSHIELRPVPRDLSSSCGTSAIFEAHEDFSLPHDSTGHIEQIVKVTDHGYSIIYADSHQ